ncbi:OB-fold-containig protein [Pelagicoccus albus]|uniref:DUF1449 family protein n=1 Tax=Pelagicoccus albus TaxID=415222 RepID=A0A7X1B2Z1_9BACT|nr:OB-fold-containig protein [Pelagicoccus albus]MBC2604709.1 DUF1449 family protein [Pelagicoccus albus]
MIDHILSPQNTLFAIALGLFLLIFMVQALSFVVGLEPFGFLDNLLPDIEIDVPEVESVGVVDSILSMLRLGKVPFVFTLIVFLFSFSLIGIYGQLALVRLGLPMLHWALASPLAFLVSLPILRISNAFMARWLPKDESYSISSDAYVGCLATVTIGTATSERPAEARVDAPDDKTHYIRVISDDAEKAFSKGDRVLVIKKVSGGLFLVVEPDECLL